MTTVPTVVPNPRVDTLVDRAPDGARLRLTTYSGVIGYGPPPIGSVLGAPAFTGGPIGSWTGAMYLPDSLPYRLPELGNATLAPQFWLIGVNEHAYLDQGAVRFAPDPRGGDTAWIEMTVTITARVGARFGYQVTAAVAASAVELPQS